MKRLFSILLLAALLLSNFAFSGHAFAAQTMELQILATSDMHGRFLPYDYALNAENLSGSAAQVASAVDELRNENTIVVDVGDVIQGNSADLFNSDGLHPMMLAMNEVGYDVWVPGNHEFNFGLDILENAVSQNNAIFLCGNVYTSDGSPLSEGYTVLERGGVKIGIIGMTTPNIVHWDAVNLKDCTVTDPVEETKKLVEILRPQVDVLIAVEHMMLDNELDVPGSGIIDLANACGELDLIVAAHGHQLIEGETVNGVPVIENKSDAATLSQALITLEKDGDKWLVKEVDVNALQMSDFSPKAALVEKLTSYHERAVADAEKKIGTFEDDYLVAPNEIREIPRAQIEDSALIDLINEMQLYYTGAEVSAAALFDENGNLYKGDIRNCDVSLIYKFSNTLYKLKMTGVQLKKWMEWSASYYNTYKEGDLTVSFNPDIRIYNYDMFSGVNYEIDVSAESGNRIVNLRWPDGTPVRDDDEFTVAVNNYRATSMLTTYGTVFEEGDALPQILEIDVCSSIGDIRELIKDYIVNVKGGVLKAACDNNWRIIGNDWDESLHQKAVELLNTGKLTVPCSDDGRTPNVRTVTVADLTEKMPDDGLEQVHAVYGFAA